MMPDPCPYCTAAYALVVSSRAVTAQTRELAAALLAELGLVESLLTNLRDGLQSIVTPIGVPSPPAALPTGATRGAPVLTLVMKEPHPMDPETPTEPDPDPVPPTPDNGPTR